MESTYKIIMIQDIPPNIKFDGYYWYSDKKKPTCIESDYIQQEWFTALPFVVEANFYSREENVSLQIKNTDGEYKVALIDLNKLEGIVLDTREYIGHDLGNRNLKMIEAWESKAFDILEGMNTLVPSWTAFAGFINASK